jgi:hypothetical protein
MNYSRLNLTVIKIPTTFFCTKEPVINDFTFSKYSDVELEIADNQFWNVI